jgi:hypothetical protein
MAMKFQLAAARVCNFVSVISMPVSIVLTALAAPTGRHGEEENSPAFVQWGQLQKVRISR